MVVLHSSEGFRNLRNTPVVVAVLQGSRSRFVGLVRWNIAKLLVVGESGTSFVRGMFFAIQPSPSSISIRRRHGVLIDGLPCELLIKPMEPLSEGFGDERIRVRSNHDVCVTRVWPFWHPAA